MDVKLREITPSQAASWLEKNTHNRNPKRSNIDKWVEDMRNKKWMLNGSTIVFAKDGTLIDGQNRLMACVKAGASFESLVVFGVERGAQDVIDIGAPRSVSDGLKLGGEINAHTLAATISNLVAYEKGPIGKGHDNAKISLLDAKQILQQHPRLRSSVKRVISFPTKLKTGTMAFIDYLGSLVDEGATARFMIQVATGADLRIGSPALFLRNRLLIGDSSRVTQRAKHDRAYNFAIHIKALNAALKEQQLRTLHYRDGEEFPSVIGLPWGKKIVPNSHPDRIGIIDTFDV